MVVEICMYYTYDRRNSVMVGSEFNPQSGQTKDLNVKMMSAAFKSEIEGLDLTFPKGSLAYSSSKHFHVADKNKTDLFRRGQLCVLQRNLILYR